MFKKLLIVLLFMSAGVFAASSELLPNGSSTDKNYVDGRIGIGTTDPLAHLHIQSDGYAYQIFSSNRNTDVISMGGTYFRAKNSVSTFVDYARFDAVIAESQSGGEDGELRWYTAKDGSLGSAKMILDEDGNLDVVGALNVGYIDGDLQIESDSNITPKLNIIASDYVLGGGFGHVYPEINLITIDTSDSVTYMTKITSDNQGFRIWTGRDDSPDLRMEITPTGGIRLHNLPDSEPGGLDELYYDSNGFLKLSGRD